MFSQNFGNWMRSRQTKILDSSDEALADWVKRTSQRFTYPIGTRPLIDSLDDETILKLWTLQLELK